jgi:polyhydroxyalkanoate synthesis repressor PhaR
MKLFSIADNSKMRDVVSWPASSAGLVLQTHNYVIMSTETCAPPRLIEIRKYSNRRYYDATRSRHLTLEAIRALIRDGCNVRVVDSRTSADITGKVLTQIILELDAPKLEIFPAAMLAEMIRVNDGLLEGFFEKFLGQAFEGFMEYQRRLSAQMEPASGWPSFLSPLAAWTNALSQPLPKPARNPELGGQAAPAKDGDLAGSVRRLQRRVQSLERELAAKARRPRRKATR